MNRVRIVRLFVGLLIIGACAVVIKTEKLHIKSVLTSLTGYPARTPAKQLSELTSSFIGSSVLEKYTCALEAQSASMKVEMGYDRATTELGVSNCIKTNEEDVQKRYEELVAGLSSESSRAELKDYYAAWLTAIESVLPNFGETREELSARQDESDAKLQLLGNRLRVEIAN